MEGYLNWILSAEGILKTAAVLGALAGIIAYGAKFYKWMIKGMAGSFEEMLLVPMKKFITEEFGKVSEDILGLRDEIKTDKEVGAHFFMRRIMSTYYDYVANGEITPRQKFDLQNDIKMYKANGFNHLPPTLMEDINRIPVIGGERKRDVIEKVEE